MPVNSWLPEMAKVSPWTGKTYEYLYNIFLTDIKLFPLRYRGHTVWFFPDMEDGKEKLFWHLTSREDKQNNGRLPDLRRSERLPWIKPSILNYTDQSILCWDYEEGDKTIKTYIWLIDENFVVIMKKYKDGTRRLITSFYVDFDSKKRNLAMKHAHRI